MAKKLAAPQWLKDSLAQHRAARAAGDESPSEMRELLADEIIDRQKKGDPFGRLVLLDYIDRLDRDTIKAHQDKADEVAALEAAAGFLQDDLFPAEMLAGLGLPVVLDLGWGRSIATVDGRHSDFEKRRQELARSRDSWVDSKNKEIEAVERTLAILPSDDSMTLREVIADPGDYGYGEALGGQ